MCDLNPVQLENWLLRLNLANQTKNHILYTLNIILKEAKRERIIRTNPLNEIEGLSRQHRKTDAVSIADLKLFFPKDMNMLLNVWGELKYISIFLLMVTSGIRLGEARALIWNYINWEFGAIYILQVYKSDKSLGIPKANEKRGIFLPKRTLDVLNQWYNESPFNDSSHLVFFGSDYNKPLNNKTVWKAFQKGLLNAEIDMSNKNYKSHSLRHTYNTLMKCTSGNYIARIYRPPKRKND